MHLYYRTGQKPDSDGGKAPTPTHLAAGGTKTLCELKTEQQPCFNWILKCKVESITTLK